MTVAMDMAVAMPEALRRSKGSAMFQCRRATCSAVTRSRSAREYSRDGRTSMTEKKTGSKVVEVMSTIPSFQEWLRRSSRERTRWNRGDSRGGQLEHGRLPGMRTRERRLPWDRGRPARMWAVGPPVGPSGQDARAPRESAGRSGCPWDRGRPARTWAEGPPVGSSGQEARAPREGAGRSGRPARRWAEGPPVGSSGQAARGPRKSAGRRGFPWDRGRPARMWAAGPPVC